MENATKALLIAGGILIAMMILSLLIYVFGSASDFAESQDKKALAQEVKEFNKGYEAYNKKKMYGTDIITVVNKAINNNRKVAQNTEDPYYVNVIIETTKEFKTYGSKTLPNGDSVDMEKSDFADLGKEIKNSSLSIGTTSLGEWNGNKLMMEEGILEFFDQNEKSTVIHKNYWTYYIYSALTDFKSSIFECTGIEYNQENGRVKTISFKQT